MSLTVDSVKVHDLDALAKGYPWKEWDLLRREAPVHWYEYDDVEPFWAITKHEDVPEISKRSDIFINGGPRLRFILKGETEALRYRDPFGVEQDGASMSTPYGSVFRGRRSRGRPATTDTGIP